MGKIIKKIMKNLENSKVSLLNSNFVMIYVLHKMLVLLKNHLNYPKDSIFKFFEKIFFL